jgi:ABC-type nitrate/sulfonate/bicarbonate transport system permease component
MGATVADLMSPIVRTLRRAGRFAIALLAAVAFLAGGTAALFLMALTGHVFPQVALVAAGASAVGVFLLFDRFNLLPDDQSDSPTGLGLGSGR